MVFFYKELVQYIFIYFIYKSIFYQFSIDKRVLITSIKGFIIHI